MELHCPLSINHVFEVVLLGSCCEAVHLLFYFFGLHVVLVIITAWSFKFIEGWHHQRVGKITWSNYWILVIIFIFIPVWPLAIEVFFREFLEILVQVAILELFKITRYILLLRQRNLE